MTKRAGNRVIYQTHESLKTSRPVEEERTSNWGDARIRGIRGSSKWLELNDPSTPETYDALGMKACRSGTTLQGCRDSIERGLRWGLKAQRFLVPKRILMDGRIALETIESIR